MKQNAHKQASARAKMVRQILKKCTLCPRRCKVNRLQGEEGYCGLNSKVRVFREMLHPFEESIINPSHQIYFAGCNLKCEFCTVAEWNSQPGEAAEIDYEQLVSKVEERKKQGAKVLNLLGGEPALSIHGILELLGRLSPNSIVILNSNMYFDQRVLALLDGFIDVYLADFKCGSDICAKNMLQADGYFRIMRDNLLAATKRADVIVRHLVLPGHLECCTKQVLNWVSKSRLQVKVSLRGDYVPPATTTAAPGKYLDKSDYDEAVSYARNLGVNLIQ